MPRRKRALSLFCEGRDIANGEQALRSALSLDRGRRGPSKAGWLSGSAVPLYLKYYVARSLAAAELSAERIDVYTSDEGGSRSSVVM